MNFLPRDICEKLVEKGCKSESGFAYFDIEESDGTFKPWWSPHPYSESGYPIWSAPIKNGRVGCNAFIFQDFCGISEQAMENCKLLFGDYDYINKLRSFTKTPLWDDQRKNMISIKTWDEWVEFMRKAVQLCPD